MRYLITGIPAFWSVGKKNFGMIKVDNTCVF